MGKKEAGMNENVKEKATEKGKKNKTRRNETKEEEE